MENQSSCWKPQILQPGKETEALKRFHTDCTWTGRVTAGSMGPGSPEMPAIGKGTFKWIINGLWVIGEFEQDQFIDNKKVLTWKCHYVCGWNYATQDYRAFAIDSRGNSSLLSGIIKGNRFVLTSEPYEMPDGQSMQLRMTWDVTNPKAITWLNESSLNKGPWILIEEYVCTPTE